MEDNGFRVGGQEDFGGATARGVEKEEDRRSFSFAGDITDLQLILKYFHSYYFISEVRSGTMIIEYYSKMLIMLIFS